MGGTVFFLFGRASTNRDNRASGGLQPESTGAPLFDFRSMPGSGKKRAKGDAAAPRGEEEADDAESDDDQVEEEVFVGLRQLGMQTGYAFCYLGGGKGNIYASPSCAPLSCEASPGTGAFS